MAYGRFNSLKIRYMEQDTAQAKVWDGAGLISRKMLRRLISQVPVNIPERRRQSIIRELRLTWINLHPFFDENYVMKCLKEESEVFFEAIQNGSVDAALNKIEELLGNP